MKAIVHIKRSVEVEVPDSLVPTIRDRWNNLAVNRLAVDLAMRQIEEDSWKQERSGYRGTYWHHPCLSWIEWPKNQGCVNGELTWQLCLGTEDTAQTSSP